jgi:hypothetical protein
MMNEQTIKARQAEMAVRIVTLLQPGQSATQDGVTVTREDMPGRVWFSVSQGKGKGKKAQQTSRLGVEQAATIFAFGF